jgi:hypothetical protein
METLNDAILIILIQNQLVAKIQYAIAEEKRLPESHMRVQLAVAKVIQKRGAAWREHAERVINEMKSDAAYFAWLEEHRFVDWNEQSVLHIVEKEIKNHSEEFAEQIRKY